MRLFHFSEDGSIARFEPRSPLALPDIAPHVWAIDEWHSPVYFLPRDCPRVCFWPLPTSTASDLQFFQTQTKARMVIAIENAWLERVSITRLYRYEFSPETFISCDDHGVHVSKVAIEPMTVEALDNLPARIRELGVELKPCDSLVTMADQVMETTLHWSLMRMRNAVGWDRPSGRPTLPSHGC